MRYKLFLSVTVFALMSVKPALLRAEWFMDLYLGAAMTDDSEVTVDKYFSRQSASERTSYDTSFTFGYRFGYWLAVFHYLGFATDMSYFGADSEKVDFSIVPVSILFMLRWPLLISNDYPHGKIQPYLGGGPSIIYYDMKVDFRPAVSEKVSEWSFENGWDFRAGVLWQFHQNFCLFGEYRYTHYKIRYKDETEEWILGYEPRTRLKVETTLDTHHFLTGISFRF